MQLFIGTSGWSYDHWQGLLYPERTPVRARLEHYAREFRTAELNTSFYRWPPPATFAGWRERLPTGFRLAVKASRFLTHYRRLGDPQGWVDRMVPGLRALGAHAGPLLVQLRADQARDEERLADFLARLPPGVPVALEARHPSWDTPGVHAVLARHGAAWCVADGEGLPSTEGIPVASGFAYIRLHGPRGAPMYASPYPEQQLRDWADRIRALDGVAREVHVYFNNDVGGHAVRDARALRSLLGDVAHGTGDAPP
ncbi:DUF72 domain-containing protein [Kineococcus arenarius]|uniref:DUF72 domain-containing protein n=1 Tax=Kineococcus sp. SYSU DK007 TaxID=3383128 RepID=UPI003D7DA09B